MKHNEKDTVEIPFSAEEITKMSKLKLAWFIFGAEDAAYTWLMQLVEFLMHLCRFIFGFIWIPYTCWSNAGDLQKEAEKHLKFEKDAKGMHNAKR